MTSLAADGPDSLVSFVVKDEATGLTYTYYKSEHGIACNYSMGEEDAFSVRLAKNGVYQAGLSEVDAVLMLCPQPEPEEAEEEVLPWQEGEASNTDTPLLAAPSAA